MSIVRSRRPESNFTTFHNNVIRDNRLSYKARGILLELLSRPDDWRVSAEMLARNSKEGRTAILSGLEELRNFGYIVTTRHRLENGQFETISVVYDLPQKPPTAENPTSVNPPLENLTPLEEPSKKKQKETTATPNGVQPLVTLFFENFEGEVEPPRGQIAGQIQLLLKQMSADRLAEIIPLVAAEGKPITVGTVAYHANRKKPEIVTTPTPPRFTAESAQNVEAVPMPEYLKSSLRGVLRGV